MAKHLWPQFSDKSTTSCYFHTMHMHPRTLTTTNASQHTTTAHGNNEYTD